MDVTWQGNTYVHGWTVEEQRISTGRTVLGQCRSYCRGEVVEDAEEQNLHFHRPWWSDAGVEPLWTVSRRVVAGCARFMSRIHANIA